MTGKRGNGEGSIHRRSNGTWRAQVSLNGHRLSTTADTRSECQAWLKKTLLQVDNGLTMDGAQTSLESYLQQWLQTVKPALRLTTWNLYQHIVVSHIIPYLGSAKLKDLRPEIIQRLYDSRQAAGTGSRTIQLVHVVLHNAMSHAVRLGILPRNPTEATYRPISQHDEAKIYDEGQISQFLVAAKGERNEALYHLAIATGMRQAELLGLKWSDVDWIKNTVRVQRQLRRDFRDGEMFISPKTKAGRRTIELGPKTVEILRQHWERQGEERRKCGELWQDNDLVFPSRVGTPMDYSNLVKSFKQVIYCAGLPEIKFHSLRHTAASLMLNHGIPVLIVSRRLGHSKVSVTLDIYAHMIPEMQHDAAVLMDELITPVEIQLHPVAPDYIDPAKQGS